MMIHEVKSLNFWAIITLIVWKNQLSYTLNNEFFWDKIFWYYRHHIFFIRNILTENLWKSLWPRKELVVKKTYFGNQSCAMFWQQTIGHIAMLITNGSNYVFRLFSHLIQKQIHNTKTSFSDMSSFFWAEFVCNLGKMTAYEWKGNNVTILGREFQAHLEMVLKKSGIKAKQWQVWCVY